MLWDESASECCYCWKRACGLTGFSQSTLFCFIWAPSGVLFLINHVWVELGKGRKKNKKKTLLETNNNNNKTFPQIMVRSWMGHQYLGKHEELRGQWGGWREAGGGRKGEGGQRRMKQCSVVFPAAYTNWLECFQLPCLPQWLLCGVPDSHLYG